ncbi:MAG TPA: hypothetical protein VJ799_07175 [Nitrososphaeraceae archaeon]|nr:hypothetical protein [Nitrososphaeraceae archaeon]
MEKLRIINLERLSMSDYFEDTGILDTVVYQSLAVPIVIPNTGHRKLFGVFIAVPC